MNEAQRREMTPITSSITNLTTSTANSDDVTQTDNLVHGDGTRVTATIGMPWRRPDIALLADSVSEQDLLVDESAFGNAPGRCREETLAAVERAVDMAEARGRREYMKRVLDEWRYARLYMYVYVYVCVCVLCVGGVST